MRDIKKLKVMVFQYTIIMGESLEKKSVLKYRCSLFRVLRIKEGVFIGRTGDY